MGKIWFASHNIPILPTAHTKKTYSKAKGKIVRNRKKRIKKKNNNYKKDLTNWKLCDII